MKYESINITRPSSEEVTKYINKWNSNKEYIDQENAIDRVFSGEFKSCTNIENVLIQCSILNDFYSTNIFKIYDVAKHIVGIKNIDERMKNGDLSLVEEIANVTISNKVKHFYSFASKFCSHHEKLLFPIYDSYVDEILRYFKYKDNFYKFNNEDLKDYKKFKNILLEFSKFYKLDQFNLKEIDEYLWQKGKEVFIKKY